MGNKTSLVPSVVTIDLLAAFSFKSRAACVRILIGLLMSVVLSTLLIPKLVFAAVIVLAPVPPFATGTMPVNLLVLTLIIFASVIEPSVIVTPATAAST